MDISLPVVLWGAYNMMALWSMMTGDGTTRMSRGISIGVTLFSFASFVFASTKFFLSVEALFWFLQMLGAVSIMATAPPSGGINEGGRLMIIGGNIRAIAALSVSLIAR